MRNEKTKICFILPPGFRSGGPDAETGRILKAVMRMRFPEHAHDMCDLRENTASRDSVPNDCAAGVFLIYPDGMWPHDMFQTAKTIRLCGGTLYEIRRNGVMRKILKLPPPEKVLSLGDTSRRYWIANGIPRPYGGVGNSFS